MSTSSFLRIAHPLGVGVALGIALVVSCADDVAPSAAADAGTCPSACAIETPLRTITADTDASRLESGYASGYAGEIVQGPIVLTSLTGYLHPDAPPTISLQLGIRPSSEECPSSVIGGPDLEIRLHHGTTSVGGRIWVPAGHKLCARVDLDNISGWDADLSWSGFRPYDAP